MVEVLQPKTYFQPPKDYFWRWADNGEVVEMFNGDTVCYRDDLISILQNLTHVGFPPASAVILLLYACKVKLGNLEEFLLTKYSGRWKDKALLDRFVKDVFEGLKKINDLPAELKHGVHRVHLLYEVFHDSGMMFRGDDLRDAVDELNSGRIDTIILQSQSDVTAIGFAKDLSCVRTALKKYRDVADLKLKLRTGVSEHINKIPIEVPETVPRDFMDQLSSDPRTVGVARLATRLIAALNIPLHAFGSGDRSLGGIADITNRGNFDKLLLSELAQDDTLLMARLINNEALYFRREEPPENSRIQKTILVDTTLKLWGVPRVFAIAAALAYKSKMRKGELSNTFAVDGSSYQPLSLHTKEGILSALNILRPDLHCGKGLQQVLHDNPASDRQEYILVTEQSVIHSAGFQQQFSSIKDSIGTMVVVSRTGQLQLFQCVKGVTRLISTAKFDLDEYLFRNTIDVASDTLDDLEIAFLSQALPPLLFPIVRLSTDAAKSLSINGDGLVVINETQRLLFIRDKWQGAIEVLHFVERGDSVFGRIDEDRLTLMISDAKQPLLKMYIMTIATLSIETIDLTNSISGFKSVCFEGNKYYVQTDRGAFEFEIHRRALGEKIAESKFEQLLTQSVSKRDRLYLQQWQPEQASILFNIKDLYVNEHNQLILGNCMLVHSQKHLKVTPTKKDHAQVKKAVLISSSFRPLPNEHARFTAWRWEDGSLAIVDSRGLLHLKSSSKAIPEMTIVLVMNRTTSCWSASGVVSGNGYFIDKTDLKKITIEQFYTKFIEPFLVTLR